MSELRLESNSGDGWRLRNRATYASETRETHLKRLSALLTGWSAVEPLTQFRIVDGGTGRAVPMARSVPPPLPRHLLRFT